MQLLDRLTSSRAMGLYPYNLALDRIDATQVRLGDEVLVMVSSYDYLSLIGDARIEDAAIAAIRQRGTSTGGVRLLTGSTKEHRTLERRLAEHYGTEDCVTFSSGYFANIGVMAALGGPDVTAWVDALSHRSVLDACSLARSPIRRFRHNDFADLGHRLARVGDRPGILFVESLYSMDGDLAPIETAAQAAAQAGLPLLVDDAHGLGTVLPPRDCGVTAWVGSLSKAIPSNGGFVATDAATADRIRHLAGPYIFSAATAPGAVAAAHAALRIVAEEPWRCDQLRANIVHFVACLGEGYRDHDQRAPIVAIRYASDEQALCAARDLRSAGFFATPIVSPAVGPNQPRLRICINAAHRIEDLSRLAAALLKFDQHAGINRRSAVPVA